MIPLLPVILQALPAGIGFVEKLFQHKPKSGTDKKAALINLLNLGLATAGHVPAVQKELPLVNTIGALIDAMVADMNSAGQLPNPVATCQPAPAAQ